MNTVGKINFYAFCALSFFSLGTTMMDCFLVYPSRVVVGEGEFVMYHMLLETAIIPVSVMPFFIITVQNIFLFWSRPAEIETGLVVISLCCLLLDWMSSIVFKIPMNLRLNEGKDIAVIQQLIQSNWGRVFFESLQGLSVLGMMVKAESGDWRQKSSATVA